VHSAFAAGSLPSLPLKEATAQLLSEFLAPLRAFYLANKHLYDAAYPDESLSAVAAAASEPAFSGLALEGVTVQSVAPHPSSTKHRLVVLIDRAGKQHTAAPSDEAPQLVAGSVLLAATNCVVQDVKGVTATVQLLGSSSFDKATGRAVCFLTCDKPGPVNIGPEQSAPPPSDTSLGAAGKLLKTLEVSKEGFLAFKGVLAEPPVKVAVNGQIKI
jgi:hypothetical protein